MGNIQAFLFILFIHFLADFPLQTHEQATLKSTSNKWLFYHVGTYTLVWSAMFWVLPLHFIDGTTRFFSWFMFTLLIGVPHFIVDWTTSRLNKVFFDKGDYHNGFVGVGADQVIHYVCLLGVFYLYGLIHN